VPRKKGQIYLPRRSLEFGVAHGLHGFHPRGYIIIPASLASAFAVRCSSRINDLLSRRLDFTVRNEYRNWSSATFVCPSKLENPLDIPDSLNDQNMGSAGWVAGARGVGISRRLSTGFERWAKILVFPTTICFVWGKRRVGTLLRSGGRNWRGVVWTSTNRNSEALFSAWIVPTTSLELAQFWPL